MYIEQICDNHEFILTETDEVCARCGFVKEQRPETTEQYSTESYGNEPNTILRTYTQLGRGMRHYQRLQFRAEQKYVPRHLFNITPMLSTFERELGIDNKTLRMEVLNVIDKARPLYFTRSLNMAIGAAAAFYVCANNMNYHVTVTQLADIIIKYDWVPRKDKRMRRVWKGKFRKRHVKDVHWIRYIILRMVSKLNFNGVERKERDMHAVAFAFYRVLTRAQYPRELIDIGMQLITQILEKDKMFFTGLKPSLCAALITWLLGKDLQYDCAKIFQVSGMGIRKNYKPLMDFIQKHGIILPALPRVGGNRGLAGKGAILHPGTGADIR